MRSHTGHAARLPSCPAGRDCLRTSIKASPVGRNLTFEARAGEQVRFHYELSQWRAEVLSRAGDFARRAVLPVVCSWGRRCHEQPRSSQQLP
ncbi:MAG: hypothetical protein AAF400_00305 [Bacteroidota bacterium]